MLATILSRAQHGMEAPLVRVEVHLASGLPTFSIVGLPKAVVRESKDRVRSALATANFEFPAGRITVNLSPADLPKEGGRFDLPIAIGLLAASGQLPSAALEGCELYGELSLNGELRPVRGMLPAVCQAVLSGHRVVLPRSNLEEAGLVGRARIAAAGHFLEVCNHLRGEAPLAFIIGGRGRGASAVVYPDLADVRGQAQAKRALEVAAAGSHSILLVGPPGTGKSMLANRLPGILPPMTDQEALETAVIASIGMQAFRIEHWGRRPFRAPHHTASAIALVGGGSHPRPGEISLAHHGVLFLDELPEFVRGVQDSLRESLESGSITISRAARLAEFPAHFQLVAAMNSCPCGHLGDDTGRCRCTPGQIQRYRGRVSGPLLDRIDLHVEVPRPDALQLSRKPGCMENSAAVLERVMRARRAQLARGALPNARLGNRQVEEYCPLEPAAQTLLERAIGRLGLSARACHRIRKVARTLADLEDCALIGPRHLGEAVQLRRFAAV